MNTKQSLSHAEFVRQRRDKKRERRPAQTVKYAYRPETAYLPYTPRPRRASRQDLRQHYDIAFRVADTHVSTPGITIPRIGPRLVSGLLIALLAFLIYTLWTSSTFTVTALEVRGNQRLSTVEIDAAAQMAGKPIFMAVPAGIEAALRSDYPDLAHAEIHVAFPNRVIVEVTERTPLLAWFQDNALTWIDASGIAFPPRGQIDGLIVVNASETPPAVMVGEDTPAYERPYVPPEMVQAMIALYPYVPSGVPMAYDPQYGIGWQDPQGPTVFFGQNTQNMQMKLLVYQTILDELNRQGIRPELISVAHLEAPFYK